MAVPVQRILTLKENIYNNSRRESERVTEEKSNKVRYFIIGISIILNSVGVIANSIAIIMRLCQ